MSASSSSRYKQSHRINSNGGGEEDGEANANPDGKILFENNCLRCHTEGSPKPVSFLKKKFKGNPEGIVEMAKRCPWGKGLPSMEIRLIAEWLSK